MGIGKLVKNIRDHFTSNLFLAMPKVANSEALGLCFYVGKHNKHLAFITLTEGLTSTKWAHYWGSTLPSFLPKCSEFFFF